MVQKFVKLMVFIFIFGISFVVLGQDLTYDKVFEGDLAANDETLESGEYSDTFTLRLKKGQEVTFVMTSTKIRTYIIVLDPNGKQYDVGDLAEDDLSFGSEARLSLAVNKSGKYEITATSYNLEEIGSYSIGVDIVNGVYSNFSTGSLATDDKAFKDGEFYDTTEFNFVEGERVTITLMSDADGFDTYLLVDTPDGQTLSNDDFPEGNSNTSRIEFIATESGTFVVKISSYGAEEIGDYVLAVGHTKP